eukprot:764376-Hanusia_phi.AAC.5
MLDKSALHVASPSVNCSLGVMPSSRKIGRHLCKSASLHLAQAGEQPRPGMRSWSVAEQTLQGRGWTDCSPVMVTDEPPKIGAEGERVKESLTACFPLPTPATTMVKYSNVRTHRATFPTSSLLSMMVVPSEISDIKIDLAEQFARQFSLCREKEKTRSTNSDTSATRVTLKELISLLHVPVPPTTPASGPVSFRSPDGVSATRPLSCKMEFDKAGLLSMRETVRRLRALLTLLLSTISFLSNFAGTDADSTGCPSQSRGGVEII